MNDTLAPSSSSGTLQHLGPARVLALEHSRILVGLGTAQAWATMAMAVHYQPNVGDVLLVIGNGETFYVIGVLSGSGRTVMNAPGELELSAPHGRIQLHARDGIELRSSVVRLIADKWDAIVGVIRQRCDDLLCQVRGVARWRAKRSETRVDDVHRTQAGRIVQQAEGDVLIDGRKINLG